MRLLLITLSTALAMIAPGLVQAEQLALPTDPVILTIRGNIANTNIGDTAEFDLAMIDALEQHTTTTETPWYDDARSFSGPLVSALFDAVGAQGTVVTVTALNDYSAEIPMSDFLDYPVIFATRLDGETLSVRDMGPLFLIYPFDVAPGLYNEVYFSRSVWQITSITVH
ncbi:hypothetical protein NIM87_09525 [Devosia sp. XJ19-1]|uniref:Oxidoreductase molybdopterin-binding domain-containing protein n=1 Tax=Devosia ureilytica TaxID=2952754 RepID=A0A9Q4APA3_9HYPH|nr:molybdopterin-dependent oxidoreductase [Devosia ureilytica]MCP8883737.1 hypothetical protein [Devosia ureilytica]MCP8887345.1 hypothetical protein [Devosia ureilytica]